MSKLYCIIGWYKPSAYSDRRQWEVCWSMSEDEAQERLNTCRIFAKTFCEQITENHLAQRRATAIDSSYPSSRGRTRLRANIDVKNIAKQEARYKATMEKLHAQEAEITKLANQELFDPLFPTATNGYNGAWLGHLVQYDMLVFEEDPRAQLPKDLIKRRAKLHAVGGEDERGVEFEGDQEFPDNGYVGEGWT